MENVTGSGFLDGKSLSEKFGVVDYVVFIGMLGISAGIGVVYGCFGKEQSSTSEFLMAGRNMGIYVERNMCRNVIFFLIFFI